MTHSQIVTKANCHICNGQLESFERFGVLRQIASDCRPHQRGGYLSICQSCITVQRPVTTEWQLSVREIYANYQLFFQGLEQLEEFIFQSETGEKVSRSFRMISWLNTITQLPSNGSLLEIGCGNGGFLANFSSYRPQWQLTGLDIGDGGKNLIEKIPHTIYVQGSLEELDPALTYDLVILSHTLEHIPYPLSLLKNIFRKLSENGMIFIQGPNLNSAPFDILVADHCSFFTPETLTFLLEESGFNILNTSTDALPKELSILGQKCSGVMHKSQNKRTDLFQTKKLVFDNIDFLLSLRSQSLEIKENDLDIGIFGSSISSSWLFGELENAKFFIDENPKRVGNTHLGTPILGTNVLSDEDTVLMPFRYDIAKLIADRLHENLKLKNVFRLPPSSNYSAS